MYQGVIIHHCKEVYESNPTMYDGYIPITMLGASNDFYNFIIDSYHVFKKEDGADRIRGLMRGVNGYALTGSLDLATKTQSGIDSRRQYAENSDTLTALDKLTKSIDELPDNPNISFENTFNISGNNPKEIAEEVSNIIQRQVERRGASWA